MELQIALYKLQLLAQKWSKKSTSLSLSWHSAIQLASIEINNHKNHVSLTTVFISFDAKKGDKNEKKNQLVVIIESK